MLGNKKTNASVIFVTVYLQLCNFTWVCAKLDCKAVTSASKGLHKSSESSVLSESSELSESSTSESSKSLLNYFKQAAAIKLKGVFQN